jgi:hypothetical protein
LGCLPALSLVALVALVAIKALLLWRFGCGHDFMYLHAGIYAKYRHEKMHALICPT